MNISIRAKLFSRSQSLNTDVEMCSTPLDDKPKKDSWLSLKRSVKQRFRINEHALAITLASNQIQVDLESLVSTYNKICEYSPMSISNLLRNKRVLPTASIAFESKAIVNMILDAPELKEAFLEKSNEECIELLSTLKCYSQIKETIDKVTYNHRYLSVVDEELMNLRLDEAPEMFFDMLRGHLHANTSKGEFVVSKDRKLKCTRLMELHRLMRDTLIINRGSNNMIKTKKTKPIPSNLKKKRWHLSLSKAIALSKPLRL